MFLDKKARSGRNLGGLAVPLCQSDEGLKLLRSIFYENSLSCWSKRFNIFCPSKDRNLMSLLVLGNNFFHMYVLRL